VLIERFHDKTNIGSEYLCTCCDQLWYRASPSLCISSYNKCSKDIVDRFVTGVNSVDNKEWICATSDRSFETW